MSRGRFSVVFFSVLIALVLIAIAAPRFVSGLVVGPFDETVRELGRGVEVSNKDARIARASRITALDWYGNTRTASELAGLNFALGTRQQPGSDVRIKYVAEAIESDLKAISLAPTAAYSWMRLAQAYVERGGAQTDVAPFLRMSYRTAPYDPRIVLPRLNFALAVWRDLPDDLRVSTADQIRLAMRWYPLDLARQTRARYRLAEVRDALRDDPAARARFNMIYLLRRDQL